MLAGSFYDGGGPTGSLLAVVSQRGITKGDFVRLHMIEAGIKPAEIRRDAPEISKPDLGEAGAGQTGTVLPE